MQQQHFPMFTVTPHGLLIDGTPLAKSSYRNLPPHILHEIGNIEALLKKVKKEDWDNPVPYAGGEYPVLVKASMRAALLSTQSFPFSASESLIKGYNPDEPRDERGRWTTGGPSFANLKSHYPTYKQYSSKSGNDGGKTIWQLIGGQIEKDNAKDPNFSNSCAIRISYTLNQSGDDIEKNGSKTVSGEDGSWYYYRISDLTNYISQTYGTPDE